MKIALLGSAPSSVRLAPFDDPEWSIWGCSPGLYAIAKRVDAWFELHRWEPPVIGNPEKQVTWFSPEYVAWMGLLKCPVWMSDKVPQIPTSEPYPWVAMVDKYGPYFFNSSLSYMLAMALEAPGVTDIGLWGVDMSATEEWGGQRLGCHHFITLAQNRGIKIHVPPESDLLCPKPLYGIGESTPMMIKLTARQRELQSRLTAAQQMVAGKQQEVIFLQGAIDDVGYVIQTWTATELLMRTPEPPAAPG